MKELCTGTEWSEQTDNRGGSKACKGKKSHHCPLPEPGLDELQWITQSPGALWRLLQRTAAFYRMDNDEPKDSFIFLR